MISNLLLSLPGGTELLYLIFLIIIILVVLIAFRKPIMWYYGIIDLINESRRQTQLLEEIRDGLNEQRN